MSSMFTLNTMPVADNENLALNFLTDANLGMFRAIQTSFCDFWIRLQRLLWIYCPRHARVSGNERADRLASTADITSGLQLGRAEVL